MDVGEAVASLEAEGEVRQIKRYTAGVRGAGFFGERALRRSEPRAATITALTDVRALRLSAAVFLELVRERERKEALLRGAALFEAMSDEQIESLADGLVRKAFAPGEKIIAQGEWVGDFRRCYLYLLESGECVATTHTGEKQQQEEEQQEEEQQEEEQQEEPHKAEARGATRYVCGKTFGEKALLEDAPRAATVTAVGEVTVLALSRAAFEERLGPCSQLQKQQYVADPRKLIADFFKDKLHLCSTFTFTPGERGTSWFGVFRPCSRDSIAKMLGRVGVGKGLNVKGKAAMVSGGGAASELAALSLFKQQLPTFSSSSHASPRLSSPCLSAHLSPPCVCLACTPRVSSRRVASLALCRSYRSATTPTSATSRLPLRTRARTSTFATHSPLNERCRRSRLCVPNC